MQNGKDDVEALATPLEAFIQVLQHSKAWEHGSLQVFATDPSDNWEPEGWIAQAMVNLSSPGQETGAFNHIYCILLSTQAKPSLPKSVDVVVAKGASLGALEAAVRGIPAKTAVLLVHVEQAWAGVSHRNGLTLESWTNPAAHMATPIERVEESLKSTLIALHSIAADKELAIVATSKAGSKIWERIESDLSGLKDLSWCNLPSENEFISDDWLKDSIIQIKEGKLSMAELRVLFERRLKDVATLETTWAQVLSADGRHHEAWELMRQFTVEFSSNSSSPMLRIAQMAADAADTQSALYWIDKARRSGIRIYQDWCCAVKLTQALGEGAIETSLMHEMCLHFPDATAVIEWQMRTAIISGDPTAAATMARRIGNQLRADLLEKIASNKFIASDLSQLSISPNEKAFALQSLAQYLISKGNLLGGLLAAAAVPKETEQEIPSLQTRWKTIGSIIVQKGSSDVIPLDIFQSLISDTLPHSNNLDIRRLINGVCEDNVTPRAHFRLFTRLADHLFDSVLKYCGQKEWRGPSFDIDSKSETPAITSFIEALIKSQPSRLLVLGKTQLPESVFNQASPGMATALIRTMDVVEPRPSDPTPWILLMMGIECICRHLGDPTTDMLAGYWLVKRTAASGDGQTARDIAENIMQNLGASLN